MIFPTLRLLALIVCTAPLWLLGHVGLWMPSAAALTAFLVLVLLQLRRAPSAGSIVLRRELPTRFAFNEDATIALVLSNTSGQPLRLSLRDELPPYFATDHIVFEVEIGAGKEERIEYAVRPLRRGVYRFGDVLARVRYGYDLISKEMRIKTPPETLGVKVYPGFRGLDNYQLLAKIALKEDVVRRPRRLRGQGSDYESLRPYIPGDDSTLIDWKASARRGTFISRVPQVERGQQLALLLDTGRLMEAVVQGQSRIEHAMSAAVRLSYVVQKRGDQLTLAAFSNKIEAFLPGVRGTRIMPSVLETLCTIQASPVESDYWQVTNQLLGKLTRRSLVVLFTDVLDPASSQGLINNLRRVANRHLVLCVVMSEPRWREIALQKPEQSYQTWQKIAACDLMRRRQLALEHMRSQGILVLETAPDALSVGVIHRYLEIRHADLQ